MPNSAVISTGYVNVAVALPNDFTSAMLTAIATEVDPMLPGGWRVIEPAPPGIAAHIALTETSATPAVTLVGNGHIAITLRPTRLRSSTLGYIGYTAAEAARQRHGMVTAHAAAVATPDGNAVLLLGDKGAGKTNVVLALLRAGWLFLGDDLIILEDHPDGLRVRAGRQRAAIRQSVNGFGYEPKTAASLADLDAPTHAGVALTVRVSVFPGASPLVTAASPLSLNERLRLAENLGRYISGVVTPLSLEPEVYAPVYPLDEPACAATRSRIIRNIERTGLWYVQAPSADHAADLIGKQLGR
jgi:hypothetical protein